MFSLLEKKSTSFINTFWTMSVLSSLVLLLIGQQRCCVVGYNEERILGLLRPLCELPEVRNLQSAWHTQQQLQSSAAIGHLEQRTAREGESSPVHGEKVWQAPSLAQVSNMIKSKIADELTRTNTGRGQPPQLSANIVVEKLELPPTAEQHQRLQTIRQLCEPVYAIMEREQQQKQQQQSEEMLRWREYQRWLPGFKGFFIR